MGLNTQTRRINSLVDKPSVNDLTWSAFQELPSGTLAFLFTDIEGSTQLWEQFPEQMQVALRRHDELIEDKVIQHGGLVVRPRGEGDSRFAVFQLATDATLAAIDIQRVLFAEPWMMSPLRVRIALHSGEADLRDGDYYGCTVNRTARLRSAAHGGQILASETIYCLVRDELHAKVSFRDLGEYNLKGLERPEHIYQPVVEDLPSEFPPLNTPDRIRSNLPLSLTSFIGREREVDELEYLLRRSRLLTITGPGGAGKTRLAIQVAQNIKSSFPDGVWFIDLASLTRNSPISQHVINILGVREVIGYAPEQTLTEALINKALLLILDNCEHLLPEIASLAEDILRNAMKVQILATSHEKLGAAGELIWRIPPLSSPDPKQAIQIENLIQYESMRLFQERAAAVKSGFTITRDNLAAVVKICVRLDGLPLAIELAAARVRALSVDEIVTRLDDRFRLLVGSCTALPRQQTLRALVDWSYDLLSEHEQILLRRLSVFSGGWTLEAAEQVCTGGDIEEWEVLDLLTGLIDKSFVIGETRNSHERYRFLETIHEFSRRRLSDHNKTEEFAQKHAAYFLKLTVNSYGKEWGPEQIQRLAWLDEEIDNLRTALERLSQVDGNEEFLLQMAGALWRYWEIRGFFTEGRAWLETALAKGPKTPGYWRANGLSGAGHLARQQGDYEKARAFHEQSLNLFRELGCKRNCARQLNALGEIAHVKGDYAQASRRHRESLSIREEIGDTEGVAVSLRQLGVIARDRGRYEHAKELLEKSLELERALDDKLLMALSINDLGLVTQAMCDYEGACSLFEEAISLQRQLNDRLGISNSLQNLGNVAKDQGDFKKAWLLYSECLVLKQELGDKPGISRTTAALAEIAFWQGKYPQAAELARQSLSLSEALGFKRGLLKSFTLLGYIAYFQGNYEIAASYSNKSLELSTNLDAPRAIGCAKVLMGLGKYAEGSLEEAGEIFHEAIVLFQGISDNRNIASTYVHLARIAYRQEDDNAAMHFLEESLSISKALNIGWTLGFVYEIIGLLHRRKADYQRAISFFQASLRLAIQQENQQGIANCLGALAGLAVVEDQARLGARLFAAAARLRREMGAKMSNSDRIEYENYLSIAHERLEYPIFEAEWSEGFSMTTEQVVENIEVWFETKACQEGSRKRIDARIWNLTAPVNSYT